jgi:hypothetical protein
MLVVASAKALVPVIASLALHVSVGAGVWVEVRHQPAPPPRTRLPPDVWSGPGVEIEMASSPAEGAPAEPALVAPTGAAPGEQAIALGPACVANCSEVNAPAVADPPEMKVPAERDTNAPRRPRPAPRRASSQATASPASSASAARPSDASAGTPSDARAASSGSAGPAFGAAGLPRGVRYLPYAYSRALPQGGWGVAGFRSAAPGRLCEAKLEIAVAEDRSIGPVDYGGEREREAVPPLCRTLFENARRLIVNGEFSLDEASLASGSMRFRVTVEVSDGEPREDADEGPNGLFAVDGPARAGRRFESSFRLNSGRRVDAVVELE